MSDYYTNRDFMISFQLQQIRAEVEEREWREKQQCREVESNTGDFFVFQEAREREHLVQSSDPACHQSMEEGGEESWTPVTIDSTSSLFLQGPDWQSLPGVASGESDPRLTADLPARPATPTDDLLDYEEEMALQASGEMDCDQELTSCIEKVSSLALQ